MKFHGWFLFVFTVMFIIPFVQADVYYFSDFEADDGGLTPTLDWEWGDYVWDGSSCGYDNYPPPQPASGNRMWGTVLNDCYSNLGNHSGYDTCINDNPSDDSILTLEVDLSGATTATLRFYEWYDCFLNWDWTEVYANGNVLIQHCGTGFEEPNEWVPIFLDLTPYAGGTVTIEFHMMASAVVNHAGWYIDDLMIDDSPMATPTPTPPPTITPSPTATYMDSPTPTILPTCIIDCPPEAEYENEPACGPDYVDEFNGGCNTDPPIFSTINCGDIICGESGTYYSGTNSRDTDWYEITVTENTWIDISMIAAFPSQLIIIEPDPDCSNFDFLDSSQEVYCQMHTCVANVGPGTYWFWVGPSVFSDWPCVLPYVIEVNCTTSSPTPTYTPTAEPPTYTPTKTPTVSPPTYTPTKTPTVSPPTYTPTKTPTVSPPTYTPTRTPTLPPPTFTPTEPPTPVFTETPLPTDTPEPPPTHTPVFTETPLPTSTPECTILGCTIYMPSHDFGAGDECCCHVTICNPGTDTYTDVPVFVLLDVFGEYFFAPDFSDFDHYIMNIPPGQTFVEVLPMFNWPSEVSPTSGILWYAAMTDAAITKLMGQYDMFEFGWH